MAVSNADLDLTKHELKKARLENLATAPASPVMGQMFYNTTALRPEFWDGTSWVGMETGGAANFVYGLAIQRSNHTGIDPIAGGGTGATTAKDARANLEVDKRTTFSNAPYTVLASDKFVSQIGTMSASRVVTLPAASSTNPGKEYVIEDRSGTVTDTNTLVVTRAGSDTIDGATTWTIATARGMVRLVSDGTSAWSVVGASLGKQHANAVAITGGTITGITDLAIADGGTGVSTLPTGLLKGAGTGAITAAAAGADYQIPFGSASDPSSPTVGQIYLNTGTGRIRVWTGSIWQEFEGVGTAAFLVSFAEVLSNKSTTTTLGTSNTLYPSQNAVKVYTDTSIAAIPTLAAGAGLSASTAAGVTTVSVPTGGITGAMLAFPQTYAVKTADTTRNNTAATADDPDLTLALTAGTYEVRAQVYAVGDATADIRFRLNAPASATGFVGMTGPVSAYASGSGQVVQKRQTYGTAQGFGVETGNSAVFNFNSIMTVTTSGNAVIGWAQTAATVADTTVQTGSYITAKRIA